jgi:circadian clock protein KaiB
MTDSDTIVLKLYVAGTAPNSSRARANLQEILRGVPAQRYRLEVIDVFAEPLRALDDGVIVTPTLVKASPPPRQQIVGDLGNLARVRDVLGIAGGGHE